MTGLAIRGAAPADAGLILTFIRELAEYERLTGEVKISEDNIRQLLFGATPHAFCEIAELGGEPVGFALWFYSVSTFEGHRGLYLEDLYVRPAARGAGAGLALMAHLARRCADEGLARMEWAVLDWNTLAGEFYDRLGATAKTEWITRKLTGEALARLGAIP